VPPVRSVLEYTETQTRIEIPVSSTYNFAKLGKFTAYGRAGIGAAFNIGISSTTSDTPVDKNNPGLRTGEILIRKDSRVPVDLFVHIGGGIKYKISKGYFFGEIRSDFGMLNQNVTEGNTVAVLGEYYFWRDPDLPTFSINQQKERSRI
jgi:hypothetical protein